MNTALQRTPAVTRASFPRFLAFATLVASAVLFTACSTTEGFGEDIKHLGGGIENSAAKNK